MAQEHLRNQQEFVYSNIAESYNNQKFSETQSPDSLSRRREVIRVVKGRKQ